MSGLFLIVLKKKKRKIINFVEIWSKTYNRLQKKLPYLTPKKGKKRKVKNKRIEEKEKREIK